MIQASSIRSLLQILLITLLSFLLVSCAFFDDDDTAYSVGGTVGGLNGILVLQNNGGNNLKIAENGKFTFSQQQEYWDHYNVTVLSQPADQTCTVTNGVGTVRGTIFNIEVECSNNFPTYRVGGTISGLSGSLVLQNNGADDLTITINGDFSFQTGLEDGKDYAVTILNQPTGQTCTVTNDSGTIETKDVTNVSVTCVTNTYTIGGAVSGLSGTLVLQNNGADDLTITDNGNFTFATPLEHDTTYSVAVSSHPTGQTCNIANGSGTVNAANITTVAVTCINNPAPTYTVGGSVSGLADSTTLVIQNNGGDNETITANGLFAFSTELTSGTAYSVTVFTQPTGQTCSVTNGSSTIGTADVTNVQVACADDPISTDGWSHPQSFSDGIVTVGGFAERFQVAIANNGEAVISYVDEIDEGTAGNWWHVFLSEKRDGSWYHPTSLSEKIDLDRDVNDQAEVLMFSGLMPQVAMGADGYTVITWNQETPNNHYHTFMTEILENGDRIAPLDFDNDSLNVHHSGGFDAADYNPSVSVSDGGDALIAWNQDGASPSYTRIFRRERIDGTWYTPADTTEYINPDTYQSLLGQAALSDTGNALIAWHQRRSSLTDMREVLRTNNFGGSWNDPATSQDYFNPTELIDTIEQGYAIDPRVAVSNNGDAIIVWLQDVNFGSDTLPARRYLFKSEWDGATWTDPQDLTEYISLDNGSSVTSHQVAMDDNGNIVIVWEQSKRDPTDSFWIQDTYMLEKRDGTWATEPVDISPGDTSPINPRIAMGGNGDTVIIWTQTDNNSDWHLFMSEYRNDSWTHPAGLDEYISLPNAIGGDVGRNEQGAVVAMNDNGDTIIVWKQYDPNNNDEERLFIAEYTSDTISHNGTTYGTVTSSLTNKVWLDRNLGASRICTALDDTECFGDYYQWGRDADGHQLTTAGTTTTTASTIDNVGPDFIVGGSSDWTVSGVDNSGALRSAVWNRTDGTSICPAGFRVPTEAELEAEIPSNATSTGLYESDLKLPTAGARYYTTTYPGIVRFIGTAGRYWASTPSFGTILGSSVLAFASNFALVEKGFARAYGFPVRCIQD